MSRSRPGTATRATSRVGRWIAAATIAVGVAVGGALGGAAAPAVAYDEGTIVALANDARAANGLGGLVSNPSLDAVALAWAQQLAANGSLSHNPAVGNQIPGGWTSWGENVAQGYGSGGAVHDGWMGSPGHRANILGDFTDIGVALIEGGGTTWAVQVFATYPGSGIPLAPPPAPEQPTAPEAAPPPAPEPAPSPTETPATTPAPVPTATAAATATADPTRSPEATAAAEVGDRLAATATVNADDSGTGPVIAVLALIAVAALVLLLIGPARRRLTRRPGGAGRGGAA